jgi:uncharacterized protein (TIGR00303 family)
MDESIINFGSKEILSRLKDKNTLFVCVIASTEISNIPGITGAGATPDLTFYTPAADVELVVEGVPHCLPDIPQTIVEGSAAPTPAIITKAAIELADIPFLVADAGAAVKPNVPYIKINENPGQDIRTGRAVENAEEIFNKGCILGEVLSKLTDHLMLGESTPAGTTTALGALQAMGYDAWGKVSGSTPENPHQLKQQIVNEGLKASKAFKNKNNPFWGVSVVGDPMIPAVAGMVMGSKVPVTLAGGTQMTAVCALIKAIDPAFSFNNLSITTTVFVAHDETSDINYIKEQIGDITVFAVDPKFQKSDNSGLQNYVTGSVKEGVGAGGAMMAAILKGVSVEEIRQRTEELCDKIF